MRAKRAVGERARALRWRPGKHEFARSLYSPPAMSSCGVGRRGMQAEGRLGIAVTARLELLRRGFEKPGEGAAAEVQVVLVRHDNLQPVLARLLDLLGQPLAVLL